MRLFAPFLVRCIAEGQHPSDVEVEALASRFCTEAFGSDHSSCPQRDAATCPRGQQAVRAAWAALTGSPGQPR